MSSPENPSTAKVSACSSEAMQQDSPDTSLSQSSPWTLIGENIPNDTYWEMQLPSPMERDFESQASLTALMQGTEITTEQAITLPHGQDIDEPGDPRRMEESATTSKEDQPVKATPAPKRRRHHEGVKMIER